MARLFNSYNSLIEHIPNEAKAVEFAIEQGLIKLAGRTCECGAVLNVVKDTSQRVGIRFRCSKSRAICNKNYSILHGTWFAKSNLPIRDQILLIYCYALETPSSLMSGIIGFGSHHTACDWFNYSKDISALYLLESNDVKIGGIGCTVEIDETCIP
jgi:hypothetical protein